MARVLAHFAALRQVAVHLGWALWPQRCLGCDVLPTPAGRLGLCALCRAALWPNDGPRCRACDRPLAGRACPCVLARAGAGAHLDGVRAPWRYTGPLAACIVRGKFGHARGVFVALGAQMAADGGVRRLLARAQALVPVPPTAARLRARGYNAPSLLALALAEACCLPLCEGLVRLDDAPARSRRLAHGRGGGGPLAPDATPPRFAACAAVPGSVVVVDDVLTTGQTLAAAAQALRAAGAAQVAAVVAACRP